MKNGLSTPAFIRLANALENVLIDFDKAVFIDVCSDGIEALELKERVSYLITVLHQYLPNDFPSAAGLLSAIVPIWDFGDKEDPLRSFAAWPLIDYIAVHGIDHPDEALPVMKTLTPLFSAEFAIRPFILKYPDLCHQHLLIWCNDTSADVRRLVSEGTRPRLPWGIQLKPFVADPTPTLVYLHALKDDESLYVRRSVANHLNDIAKDHPDVVITTCKGWIKSFNNKVPNEVQWLIKHATRTIVKQGNPKVFSLLGYTDKPKVETSLVVEQAAITLGESLCFDVELTGQSSNTQNFVVDYVIHFVKANGATRGKVFKLKNVTLMPGKTMRVRKKHTIKPITTRKYYSGEHKIEILVNGESKANQSFYVHIK